MLYEARPERLYTHSESSCPSGALLCRRENLHGHRAPSTPTFRSVFVDRLRFPSVSRFSRPLIAEDMRHTLWK